MTRSIGGVRLFLSVALLSVSAWLVPVGSAHAVVLPIVAQSDTTIRSDQTGDNFGAYNRMWIGRNGKSTVYVNRGLLQFDLSAIPVGATINSASVTVRVTDSHNKTNNVGLYRALVAWGEGAKTGKGGGAASSGEASWTSRQTGTANWAAAGGQASTDYASSATASVNLSAENASFTWSGLKTDVDYWLANPTKNFGWFLIGNETTSQAVVRIATSEDTTASNRPTLNVDYSISAFGVSAGPTPATLRVMKNSTATSATTVRNNGDAAGTFSITSATNLIPSSTGQSLAAGGTANLTARWSDTTTTGARTGSFKVHNTTVPSDADETVNITGAVVDNRIINGPGAMLDFGNLLVGATVTAPLTFTSTTGDDNSFTRVSIANQTASGLTLTGTPVTFNGTNGSNARTVSFIATTVGNISTSAGFAITPEGIGDTGYSPVNVAYKANVGTATAATTPAGTSGLAATFNAANKMVANTTTSYAGLSSQTTAGGGVVGTKATILAGAATPGQISMNWRTRADNEKVPGAMFPEGGAGGISDVLEILGTGSDRFVLEMGYDPNLLPYGPGSELAEAAAGTLFPAWLDLTKSGWVKAGTGTNQGKWSTFASSHGVTDMNAAISPALVGSWGVDTDANTVWVVTDHNSQYMAVPEPSTLLLALLAGLAVLPVVRKRWYSPAVGSPKSFS